MSPTFCFCTFFSLVFFEIVTLLSIMGEARDQVHQAEHKNANGGHKWAIREGDHDDNSCSTCRDNSSGATTVSTSSSSDMVDDASSPTSCSSSNSNSDPLFEMSDLMAHLPIKRGLSKCYQGKSQSFICLSRVMSAEDLAKKGTPYSRKLKASKSQGNGLDIHKTYTLIPKPAIYKKASRAHTSSLTFPCRRSGSFLNSRLPPVPLQKKF